MCRCRSGPSRRRGRPRSPTSPAAGLRTRRATAHRAGNVDDPVRLERLVGLLESVPGPTVLPLHPRTAARLEAAGLRERLEAAPGMRLLPPLGYLDFMKLAMHARGILTDSGGVQKEAYLLGVRCVTLREQTEWVETVEAGWNTLVGLDTEAALAALDRPPPWRESAASVRRRPSRRASATCSPPALPGHEARRQWCRWEWSGLATGAPTWRATSVAFRAHGSPGSVTRTTRPVPASGRRFPRPAPAPRSRRCWPTPSSTRWRWRRRCQRTRRLLSGFWPPPSTASSRSRLPYRSPRQNGWWPPPARRARS